MAKTEAMSITPQDLKQPPSSQASKGITINKTTQPTKFKT